MHFYTYGSANGVNQQQASAANSAANLQLNLMLQLSLNQPTGLIQMSPSHPPQLVLQKHQVVPQLEKKNDPPVVHHDSQSHIPHPPQDDSQSHIHQVPYPQNHSLHDQLSPSSPPQVSRVPQLSHPPQLKLNLQGAPAPASSALASTAAALASQSPLTSHQTLKDLVSSQSTPSVEASHSSQVPQLHTSQTSTSPFPQPPKSVYESTTTLTLLIQERVDILTRANPHNIDEYSKHLFEILTLIKNDDFDNLEQLQQVVDKYDSLIDEYLRYIDHQDPIKSKVYVVVQTNFDLFIKIITNYKKMDLGTKTIRFLTNLVMHCNYWEIYNLLQWKPAIYHFLQLIQFDIHDCYSKFIQDYQHFNFNAVKQPKALPRRSIRRRFTYRGRRRGKYRDEFDEGDEEDDEDEDEDSDLDSDDDDSMDESFYSHNPNTTEHDKFVEKSLKGLAPKEKKRRGGAKLNAHRIIKKASTSKPSTKSSNYDPDVIHECQLPSPDEPHKICLRRFSRKYELTRHQETVHSKKKKLFKCYVCVKLNPGVGPRIFTRHDTLAKHIRVNHKISGKEAKAEVAYSKKHAEVVEEGDITVHVGRRKTKVDFELRAHMERRKSLKDGEIEVDDDMFDDLDSGDEIVTYNKPN